MPGSTASSTLTASPTTSGPIPSPAMIANFTTSPPPQACSRRRQERLRTARRRVVAGRAARILSRRGLDVDAGFAEQCADPAERTGPVDVVDDQVDALGPQIEIAAVDLNNLLPHRRARQRARDVDHRSVGGDCPHIDDAAVIETFGGGANT